MLEIFNKLAYAYAVIGDADRSSVDLKKTVNEPSLRPEFIRTS